MTRFLCSNNWKILADILSTLQTINVILTCQVNISQLSPLAYSSMVITGLARFSWKTFDCEAAEWRLVLDAQPAVSVHLWHCIMLKKMWIYWTVFFFRLWRKRKWPLMKINYFYHNDDNDDKNWQTFVCKTKTMTLITQQVCAAIVHSKNNRRY